MSGVATPPGLPSWSGVRHIGHYGGDPDKTNCTTETTPYAASWYRELRGMRGSAYAKKSTGLVHAEHIAIARSMMAVSRASEKMVANSLPATADEGLRYWTTVQAVPWSPDDEDFAVRARCNAKFMLPGGPTIANEDAAIAKLLGAAFVRCWRPEGAALSTPPPITYWPVVNPGPASHDLGGGCWLSERANLVVEVVQPPNMTTADFLRLMNVDLYQLLDQMLPTTATFNWCIGCATGFVLDVSQLDFTGFGP